MVPGKAQSLGAGSASYVPLKSFTASLHPTAAARERGGGSANKQPHPFNVHQLTRTEMNCPVGRMPPASVAGCRARVDKEGDVP